MRENDEPLSKDGEDFTNITQGHLIEMTCGHRGRPSRL